jgi:RNA-directed DNA polymerase
MPCHHALRFAPSPHRKRERYFQNELLDYLWHEIMYKKVQWIIDLDIRKFFDTEKHEILRQLLHKRVRDGVIIRLIGKWLKAGVLEDGSIRYNDEGTPQGGIISPMPSNIYLHEALDKWFAEVAQPRLRGRSLIVRFADDVILGFENKTEAEKVLLALNRRFERYGLELHPEKTRLLYFGKPGKSNDSSSDS